MADDLKDMLNKLLKGGGKKKFFFAYGLGKRKDKKGDGELIVRGKKPKKTEIEEEIEDCKEVYEGACWTGAGPENGETIYFQGKGKKLSSTLVTKMTLTAKHTTSRQYDFQMPTAEEEARAEKLTEGGEEVVDAPTSLPPAPSQTGAELTKRLNAMTPGIKVALAGPEKGRVQTLFTAVNTQMKAQDFVAAGKSLDDLASIIAKPAESAPPTAQNLGAELTKRLNAMTADIKAALAGPQKGPVQTLFAAVNGALKTQDFAQAAKTLDELALALKPAAPITPEAKPEDDRQAQWDRKVTELEPRVLEAQKTRAGEAKWMTMFTMGQDLGAEGDFAKALVVLERLEGLLNTPPPVQPSTTSQGGTVSNVALQQSILVWDAARKKTHADLQRLEKEILELFAGDARLAEVKQKVRKFDDILGEYADDLRDRLDEAYNASAEDKPEYCSIALEVLKPYRSYISGDPFIKAVANNLLQPINFEEVLGKTLDMLAKKLS